MSARHFVPFVCICFSMATSCLAALPLTVKEISLMLRSGYSSASVLKDLSVCHFADTFTGTEEHLLQQAGASPELLDALRQGTYSLSAEQTAAAKQKLADVTKRETAEGDRLRHNTLYRDQVAQSQKGGVFKLNTPSGPNVIHDLLKDQLVSWQNGNVTRFDDGQLENKKLIGLYFSARWCGPCRKFTPVLVDYYNRMAPQHPEFEIIFVSDDKSASGMETYMRETSMPWPAIDFQKLAAATAIKKYAGNGIPCLVLVDSNGKVVSNSYEGSTYVGPKKVLTDLDAIFAKGALAQAQ